MKLYFLVAALISIVPTNSFSLVTKSIVNKPFAAEGFLSFAGEELIFTRFSDGEAFEIVENPELSKKFKERDVKAWKVKVDGKITLSSIFHKDHLQVDNFELIEPYVIPDKPEASNNAHRMFSRSDRRP